MNVLEAAHAYVQRGWFVFPVARGGKEPLLPWREQSTIDPAQVDAWWGPGRWHEGSNIGIDCGSSDLLVIDVDDLDAIDQLTDDLGERLDGHDTLKATTPRGGLHLYFQAGGHGFKNSQSKIARKVDVRGDGGFVLAYPSTVVIDGVTADAQYSWVNGAKPAPLPERLVYVLDRAATPVYEPESFEPRPTLPVSDTLTDRWAQAALEGELDAVASAPEGTRNARLFEAGLKLYGIAKGGFLDPTDVGKALMDVGVNRAGQTQHEALRTLQSAWERSIARGPQDWNDKPKLVEPPRVDAPDDGEPGFEILGLAELADLPPPRWVLENRIPEGLTWMIGHPKVGKSFVGLDWAAATAATGKRVLYMAGEGVHGFAKRVIAWSEAHPAASLDSFGVSPTVPRLLDPGSIATFYRTVRRFKPDLVVIDTWSRATPGSDENSHSDMSLAIDHVDKARAAYGCSVLIIHHTNVAGARARGHTSLDGAADAIWHVKRDPAVPDVLEIENTATKDWEQIPTILGRLQSQGNSAVLAPSAVDRLGWR